MSDIKRMPPLSSKWMNKRLHAVDYPDTRPTHFANGVERPARKRELDTLVDTWTRTR